MRYEISAAYGQLIEGLQSTQRDLAASILTSPTGDAAPSLLRERQEWIGLMRACPMFVKERADAR